MREYHHSNFESGFESGANLKPGSIMAILVKRGAVLTILIILTRPPKLLRIDTHDRGRI